MINQNEDLIKKAEERAGQFYGVADRLNAIMLMTDELFVKLKEENNGQLEWHIAFYYDLRESFERMDNLLRHLGTCYEKTGEALEAMKDASGVENQFK